MIDQPNDDIHDALETLRTAAVAAQLATKQLADTMRQLGTVMDDYDDGSA